MTEVKKDCQNPVPSETLMAYTLDLGWEGSCLVFATSEQEAISILEKSFPWLTKKGVIAKVGLKATEIVHGTILAFKGETDSFG